MKKLIFVLILLFSIDITHRLLLLLPFTWFKSEVKDTVVEPVVQDDLLDKSKESILKWLQDVRATFEVEKRQMGILFYRLNYSDSKYGEWGWYKDGDEKKNYKYVGEIKNGKPNGQGKWTLPYGNKYEGEWKDGKKHGQGSYTFGRGKWEGDKYEGEWKDGKKHGQATYTSSSGRNYEGEWKDGEIWKGTHFDKDGNIIAKWWNGVKQ